MNPIVPSRSQFEVLREVAGSGFNHVATKRLCCGSGWELIEDEPNLGFVRYSLSVGPDHQDRRLLSVGTANTEGILYIYLPLFYFPEEDAAHHSENDRTRFDEAFRRLRESSEVELGRPERTGTYEYPHRSDWAYSYCVWRLPEAQVILLQDEHDIQFGMDVSLWLFPVEPDVSFPLSS
jgi:hypothetical protein